jgi:adenylate cyclase class 2
MIEVERKYRCSSSVVAAVETVAERVAAPVDQTDLYLNSPDRDFAETDEALRIRRASSVSAKSRSGELRYRSV